VKQGTSMATLRKALSGFSVAQKALIIGRDLSLGARQNRCAVNLPSDVGQDLLVQR
jgi:hypothetical protein